MAHLIGIDVGTTTIKAVLLDAGCGRLVDQASRPNVTHHPRPEWSEFHPDEVWESIASCLREMVRRNEALDVRGLAVASMGEAGLPIDGQGNYLHPIIAWHDPRTEPFDNFWRETLGAWKLFQITGLAIRHIFTVNKLMWLRAHHPEVMQRTRKWLCMEDFVILKLSGEYATDITIASRTMALDQRTKRWSAEIFDTAGFDTSIFPEVYPSGKMVGELTAAAASQTGLAKGIPVVTGGHDHLCAALAAGLLKEGQILDSSGTAQAVLGLSGKFQPSRKLFRSSFTHYPHVVAGQYIVQGGLPAAGGSIEWFARLVTGNEGVDVPAEAYATLFSEAEAVQPGSGGVVCFPYLLGTGPPLNDPTMRGALLGLSLDHSRAHVFRSLIEGLGYSLRESIETCESASGHSISEVIAVGGANRSSLVKQVKADATGRTIKAPELVEATATGAALLAGLGVGLYADALQAYSSLSVNSPSYLPNPDAHTIYDRLYRTAHLQLRSVVRRVVQAR